MMQMGVRWRAGESPHNSVPSALHAEIAAQESVHPDALSWTLTWLEGRPRCDLDGLVVVRLTADGLVVASSPDAAFDIGGSSHSANTRNGDEVDDDDDDWLK